MSQKFKIMFDLSSIIDINTEYKQQKEALDHTLTYDVSP